MCLYLKSHSQHIITLIIICIFHLTASAGVITGTVIDANDSTPLPQCTIKLSTASDKKFVAGSTTQNNGSFTLPSLNSGKYLLQCSYMGYNSLDSIISITPQKPNVQLGKIPMSESSIVLQEAVVIGKRTEITVKEDTIEYNASSFSTQPNSVIEDLLQRLPGVEIDGDGKIIANGKVITKILVDGKEFFVNDPKVATKNLPTSIIDKLQVIDRKSRLARLTGVDDGEDETVINLTIKPGMNKGWFGNASAGYGTDNRHKINAMANKFWDGNQITFLGGANNVNDLGFTNNNAARFRQFGGNHGITTSQNAGINFSIGKDTALRLSGNVMYAHGDNESRSSRSRQYLLSNSSSYNNALSSSSDNSHALQGSFRISWNIDSLNVIDFQPRFSFNTNISEKSDTALTLNDSGEKLNSSRSLNSSDGRSFEFGGDFIYNHKFKQHRGRSFSVMLGYNHSNIDENQYALSKNVYRNDSTKLKNQRIDNNSWANMIKGRISWTEPLGDVANGRFMEVSYLAQYKWNNTDKLVYDRIKAPTFTPDEQTEENLQNILNYEMLLATDSISELDEDILNPSLSNSFLNKFLTQTLQLGYKKISRMYNLNIGIALSPSTTESRNFTNSLKNIPTQWLWNFAPYLRYRYKMKKRESLQAEYRAKSIAPPISKMQPVTDNSNPQRIVIGNPNLKPAFYNNFSVRYNGYNVEHQRSIMAQVQGSFTSNSVISKNQYNPETGVQTITYENVNGVWNVMGNGMISFPFRNKNWQFTNHTSCRYSVNKGYTNNDYNRSTFFTINESAGITFRTDVFEIDLRPNYSLQTTHNTVKTNPTPMIHKYGVKLYTNYYLPFGLNLNSNIAYSDTKGFATGYNTSQWIWNASISYQFLHKKAATIEAKAYDILNQRKSISRYVTANYIQDQEYNNLTRYFMLSFAYRFNTFSGGKIPKAAKKHM